MKKFDLNAAMNGAKVITRDGRPVKIAGYNEDANSLIGWIGNVPLQWTGGGNNSQYESNDLFMAPTERKEWIVRFTHKVQKHITYCSSPHKIYEDAEYFAIGQKKNFYCTIHEITIIE